MENNNLFPGWNTMKECREFSEMANFLSKIVSEENLDDSSFEDDDESIESEESIGYLTNIVLQFGQNILFKEKK
jgi:hypothetical protein